MFDSRFSWHHPYGWRTNLRGMLPRPVCWWINKGKNCEEKGAEHHWYNQDNQNSACYHCEIVRAGQLWRQD